MIKAVNLSKGYGRHLAVDKINFEIARGEVLGFLGPNGAGKSTTMNMITGYIAPSAGQIFIDGQDIQDEPEKSRSKIGYLPEQPPLYPDMTVKEYLHFTGELKGCKAPAIKRDMDKICDLIKIGDVRSRLIGNLSKGYKQRVGLAQALMANPPILILDEPTVGLDPKQIMEIRTLIQDLSREHTIVLSSHILPEVSAVCQRVLILHKGRIAASDSPGNLAKELAGLHRLRLKIKGEEEQVRQILEGTGLLNELKLEPSSEEGILDAFVAAKGEQDIRESLFYALAEARCPILQMGPRDVSLEEIFLNVTTVENQRVQESGTEAVQAPLTDKGGAE